MVISAVINGAAGRMGQLACEVIKQLPDFRLVAQCGRCDDLAAVIKESNAQVVLDFTTAASVYQNTEIILRAGARAIIGTTGLSQSQVEVLRQIARAHRTAGIIAPNFSIGALLMMRFSQLAAHYFSRVEIIEMHHDKKHEVPSGTAMRTAEMLNAANEELASPPESLELLPGAGGAQLGAIKIHSLRLPGVMARQQVIFGGVGETLTLDHNSQSREAFVAGIRFACEKIMLLDDLIYGLDQLMVDI